MTQSYLKQKKYTLFKRYYILSFSLLLLALPVAVFAQTKTDSIHFSHSEMNSLSTKTLYVRTNPAPGSSCTYQAKKAVLKAYLYMGDTYMHGSNTFSGDVTLKVDAYTSWSGSGGLYDTWWIKLSANQDKPEELFNQDFLQGHPSINRFEIKVAAYTSPAPTYTPSIQSAVFFDEEMGVGVSSVNLSYIYPSQILLGSNQPDTVTFKWRRCAAICASHCKEVPNYQFQLLRIYNTDSTKKKEKAITAIIDWKQALSVETGSSDTTLSLHITEGTGFYLWRVRPIGTLYEGGIADSRNWGSWSQYNTGTISIDSTNIVTTYPGAFYYTQFDDTLNWIYSRTFSEGDPESPKVRMSEKITYANGLQQVKQTQAYLPSEKRVLLTQTVYDWSGRAALTTMAAPLGWDSDSIKYRKLDKIFKNGSSPYTAANFDEDNNFYNPATATGWISDYYSNNNTADTLVPNAENYPFSRALYERDGTGRIREQGGPGETHRIKTVNARTTRTFYGGVSDKELLRILGDEAPEAASMHKVVNLDANSIATISYVDKAGQTLATCLSKIDSTLLDTLPSQGAAGFTVNDTIKGNAPYGQYGIVSAKPLVLAVPTSVTFSYHIGAKDIKYLCMNYCKNCDYKIEILVRNDITDTVISKLISAANCTTPKPHWDTSFTQVLGAGSYSIERRVYANNIKPNSATDSTSAYTYLDEHLKNLRKQLQDTADAKLACAYSYLNASNLTGLYQNCLTPSVTVTGVNNPDSVFQDSSRTINIKCGTVKVPILFCKGYDCSDSTPDFEAHFNKRWSATHPWFVGTNAGGYLKWLPMDTSGAKKRIGFKPGEFNWMIKNMTDTSYNCQNLWACWDRIVQNYASLDTLSDTTSYNLDVLRQFLNCTGTMYKGYANKYPSDTAKWRGKAYKWFFYKLGNKPDCDSAIKASPPVGQGAISGWGEDPLNGSVSSQKWRNYRDCIENLQSPSTQTVGVATASAKCGCEGACEDRYESFKTAIIKAYHNDSLYVEGDKYYLQKDSTWGQEYEFNTTALPGSGVTYMPMSKVECAARSMVENCKKYCMMTTYTTGGHVDSVGNPTEKANIEKAMTWSFEVKRPSCGSGWDTIKPLSTSGDTSFVRLWEKHYGGTADDQLWDMFEDKLGCGGYLLAGWTKSPAGNDITEGHCTAGADKEWWVVKVNQYGEKLWDRTFGGTGDEELRSVIQTHDGGWLLGGISNSDSTCEKTQNNRGGNDYWVMKVDAIGNVEWDKRYGGTGDDQLQSVWQTRDGYFLLGGYSSSPAGGDKSDNTSASNNADFWLIKTAFNGTKMWDTIYGTGVSWESSWMYSVREDKEGNYVLAGTVDDEPISDGMHIKYNVYKINKNNQVIWHYTYGDATYSSYLNAMEPIQATGDSGYMLAGFRYRGAAYGNDYWIVKIDKNGNSQWNNYYGGTNSEVGSVNIRETNDKGFIVAGNSGSLISGNKTDTLYGVSQDYWIVRIDSAGNKKWDRSYGGTNYEYHKALDIDQANDYWIAGFSESNNTGNKSTTNYGATGTHDYWVLRGRDWCRHDTLCFKWVKYKTDVPDSVKTVMNMISCDSVSSAAIKTAIQQQVEQYIQAELKVFSDNYFKTCALADSIKDTFALSYPLGYHHYTLYYYDRAGNLVRTNPPAGVSYYTNNHRMSTTGHAFKTKYKYNSLKQLSEQETPDGGKTEFWYDYKGQLRFSRNAKQKLVNKYSYTKYDNLGRIIEVGESGLDGASTFYNNANTPTYPGSSNSQRVYTVYTTPGTNIIFTGNKTQRFLQNRISYTNNEDNVYTYYSYDPHGNVEWLIQDVPGLGKNYIGYEYDLVSNKVLKVHYNESGVDEFHHRYSYDEDQRIKKAETGWGGFTSGTTALLTGNKRQHVGWDKDAAYKYYKHGPLKRIEIGEDKVQGLDHVYAINGWLKAANYVTTSISDDPGADGNNGFSKDIFGMVLGYHSNDFNRTSSKFNPSNSNLISSQSGISNVFNGNISSLTFKKDSVDNGSNQNDRKGYKYRYDQLNRVKKEDYSNYTSSWQATTNFDNSYTYDANGNVDTLKRRGAAGNNMDELKYRYTSGTNKLEYIDDGISSIYGTDIDDQSSGNYLYDAIGQMTKDVQESIDNIDWTTYNKVKSIKKSNGDSILFVYDANGNRVMKTNKPASGSPTVTYYIRDNDGNILGLYERTTSGSNYVYKQKEVPIYGSERIGEFKPDITVKTVPTSGCGPCGTCCSSCDIYTWTINIPKSNGYFARNIAKKEYEMKDHLGNIHEMFSDRKNSDGTANVLSYQNYYAFGMQLVGTGMTYFPTNYKFGFNGKIKDDDIISNGRWQDYGEREYRNDIIRFISVDPLTDEYPELSTYQFAGNNPISAIDVDGLEPAFINPVGGVPTTPGDNFRTQQPPPSQIKVDPTVKIETNAVEAAFTAGIGGFYTILTGESAQTGQPATFGDYVQATSDILTLGTLASGRGGKGAGGPKVNAKTSSPKLTNTGTFGGGQSTKSGTQRQAFNKAKNANAIPKSQQPNSTEKIDEVIGGKKTGNKLTQYNYTNSKGEKISIRKDNPRQYGDGGKGDQGPHYNSGKTGADLKQHHDYGTTPQK